VSYQQITNVEYCIYITQIGLNILIAISNRICTDLA